MDDLTARLHALVRTYAAAIDQRPGREAIDRLSEQFRRDLGALIAEYGRTAVDEALDELPDGAWPSVELH
jgi:hypothetical protein